MSGYRGGWDPGAELPIAEAVTVTATLRNDVPVVQLQLYDIARDHREIQLTESAAYDVLDGVVAFLNQLHKARRAEARKGLGGAPT